MKTSKLKAAIKNLDIAVTEIKSSLGALCTDPVSNRIDREVETIKLSVYQCQLQGDK